MDALFGTGSCQGELANTGTAMSKPATAIVTLASGMEGKREAEGIIIGLEGK
jgi:hypothetical protein